MTETVDRHYAAATRHDAIMAAVREALPKDRPPVAADLAPLDQFHMRGLAATAELAALVSPTAATAVLDLGSGLGGPARHLAARYACHVTGVDITPEYGALAKSLTELVGLSDRVRFETGDAAALPFADESFDLVWTQHVVMNIEDRARVYAEVFRVLRRGGRFAMYDQVALDGGPLHFPVPWARGPEASFLLTAEATRSLLEAAGFAITHWQDATQAAKDWRLAQNRPDPAAAPPPLGLHLLLGPDFATMSGNYGRNIADGRIGLLMAVVTKP